MDMAAKMLFMVPEGANFNHLRTVRRPTNFSYPPSQWSGVPVFILVLSVSFLVGSFGGSCVGLGVFVLGDLWLVVGGVVSSPVGSRWVRQSSPSALQLIEARIH